MDFIIKLVVAVVIFITSWLYQIQNQEWIILRDLLKDSNNIAVHAAAIQAIDELNRSLGTIIIDPVNARSTFENMLQLNLGLNTDNEPLAGSRISSKVNITYFEVIDDTNKAEKFPYLYENEEQGLVQYLHGPVIIAVIEIDHPKIVNSSRDYGSIRVPAIYEHKPNSI